MSGIHIYVHVPFCIDTCGYCDFYRKPYGWDKEKLYVGGLISEIGMQIRRGSAISSLYFGGGTPSLLTEESWRTIFREFQSRCSFLPDAEISLEANPASITQDRATFWRDAGFNRISVGVQSLNDGILRFLNRLHTSDDAISALETLQNAGWNRVNADLIYGIPDQTLEDCETAVERLAPFIQHLSAYALTVESHTPFARQGVAQRLPKEDSVAEQYEAIWRKAEEHRLARYEVSNFSHPGDECRHNANTWGYGSYVGLGPSAAGFDGRVRYKNVSDLSKYIEHLRAGRQPAAEEEIPDEEGAFRDRLMLGLRTRDGARLSPEETTRLKFTLDQSELAGFFEETSGGFRLKVDHLMLLNEILGRVHGALVCR